MKNSVLILGIALVSFSTIGNAKNTVNLSDKLFQNIILSDDTAKTKNNESVKFEKPSLAENLEVFNPETVIAAVPKTIKEIIAEGDKIVENTVSDDLALMEYEETMRQIVAQSDLITENSVSDVVYPLQIERTLSDEIAEMELIIDSNVSSEAKPLDFKKINSESIMINSINTKKFVGMN
ncbi:hypothetical protein [Flavobacterium aquicola]|uniref:Uncharacterized protein n=1 Tax=Flavobacterium aquicola TaxID=1682742 RepID=A0A3E0EWR6_9FLAO|nr:hypothetical protein [Flavobacterium aquicola]REH01597.1 hypothetical protein C8P67_10175 [Flavobacterium aquicola]